MTALTLYEIASEYRQIADHIAEMDIDEQTLADTLEAAAFPVEQKSCAVAAVIGNLEAEASAYKAHAERAAAIAKTRQSRVEWLKRYLLASMQKAGISEIKSEGFAIKLRDNPESVEVFQAELIPGEFMRQPEPPPPAPDKTAIKAAIKSGADVPGARLHRTQRVEIR